MPLPTKIPTKFSIGVDVVVFDARAETTAGAMGAAVDGRSDAVGAETDSAGASFDARWALTRTGGATESLTRSAATARGPLDGAEPDRPLPRVGTECGERGVDAE